MLVAVTQMGDYQKLKGSEFKGYSIIRGGTVERWGGCREGERKYCSMTNVSRLKCSRKSNL